MTVNELTKREALALALSLNKPAVLVAYAKTELQRLYGTPTTCWRCKAEVPDQTETCPNCGAD